MLDIKPIYRHRLELSKDHGNTQNLKIYTCIHCGMIITDTENASIEELEASLIFKPCKER